MSPEFRNSVILCFWGTQFVSKSTFLAHFVRTVSSAPHRLIVLISCLLTIFTIVYISCISTLTADDFVRGANFDRLGISGSIFYEYFHWDGRFTSYSLEYIAAPALKIRYFYPVLLMSINAFSLLLMSSSIYNCFKDRKFSFLIALCIYIIIIANSINPGNSMFWMAALIENILSVSILSFILSKIMISKTPPQRI